MEILVDLYCNDAGALADIQHVLEGVEVEYASGLSALEIAGTLVIPSTALLFQVVSFIKDQQREKAKSLEVKKIEIHIGPRIIVLPPGASVEEIAETINAL